MKRPLLLERLPCATSCTLPCVTIPCESSFATDVSRFRFFCNPYCAWLQTVEVDECNAAERQLKLHGAVVLKQPATPPAAGGSTFFRAVQRVSSVLGWTSPTAQLAVTFKYSQNAYAGMQANLKLFDNVGAPDNAGELLDIPVHIQTQPSLYELF